MKNNPPRIILALFIFLILTVSSEARNGQEREDYARIIAASLKERPGLAISSTQPIPALPYPIPYLGSNQVPLSSPPQDLDEEIKKWIEDLGSDNPDVRWEAAEELRRRPEAAVRPLINALERSLENDSDKNKLRVQRINRLLSDIGRPATEPLVNVLNNSTNTKLKNEIISILPGIGYPGAIGAVSALEKLLSDDNHKARAILALGLLQTIGPLKTIITDPLSSLESKKLAAIALVEIGPDAIKDIVGGISNPGIPEEVKSILVDVKEGNIPAFRKALEEQRNKEINPVAIKYIDGALQYLDKKKEVATGIQKEFNIQVDKGFSLKDLKSFSSLLKNLPRELTIGLLEINRLNLKDTVWTGGGYAGSKIRMNYSAYSLPSLGTHDYSGALALGLTYVLIHEIAHYIDDKHFKWGAFKDLYARADKTKGSPDFAANYGRENSIEDFATTVAEYVWDSRKEFLRAIEQAKDGKPVYLEKLLFVANVFTTGHQDYTVMYKIQDDGTVIAKQVSVVRDPAGEIIRISGIDINNLDGLKTFFTPETFFAEERSLDPEIESKIQALRRINEFYDQASEIGVSVSPSLSGASSSDYWPDIGFTEY